MLAYDRRIPAKKNGQGRNVSAWLYTGLCPGLYMHVYACTLYVLICVPWYMYVYAYESVSNRYRDVFSIYLHVYFGKCLHVYLSRYVQIDQVIF